MSGKHEITNSEVLAFTGERYLPEVRGNIELEHLHRYLLTKQAVVGKTVLDIASGEGYGSAMLAESAHRVTGVDISQEAVSHAQTKYRTENLEFRLGSCSAIPLGDASVDVVVSFETIEHHDEHEAMMREVKRVLRPDGVMIISSPDKLEYSDKPGYRNPYHIQELYRDEFRKLLDLYFKNHSIYGQRVVYGSAIFLENGFSTVESYGLSSSALSPIAGVPYPVYLIAVASDAELPVLGSGILEQSINETDVVKGWMGAVAERDEKIRNLNQTEAERDEKIRNLNQTEAELNALAAKLKESQEQISSIIHSNSWRLTSPLREVRRWLSNPQRAKRFVNQTFYIAKRTYQALPLSHQTKMAHRLFLANHLPWTLRAAAHPASAQALFVPKGPFVKGSITNDLTADRIKLQTSPTPQVSVIIPIYGKCDYTIRCLASIAINPPSTPFEIIVVDDCSPDRSVETLQHIEGIRLITNSENKGFIRSCNIGAKNSKGAYLYFLNNDTEVTPGWLDELVELSVSSPPPDWWAPSWSTRMAPCRKRVG